MLSRHTCLRIGFLLIAALTNGKAQAESPVSVKPASKIKVPFEARSMRRLDLFRGSTPKKGDMTEVAADTVVTVLSLEGEQPWEGRSEQVVQVKLDSRSKYYTLLSRLEPVDISAGISAERAGELLFAQIPKARRSWCAQFARRLLLSEEPQTLVYSASADADCAGYLAVVSGSGKEARVLKRSRRGHLQSVAIHKVSQSPGLLETEESFQENARTSGIRRSFLGLGKPSFEELLVVDIRRDTLDEKLKHSVIAEVEVKPSDRGLDVEVHRKQLEVSLVTGVEKAHTREAQRYHYANGKMTLQKSESSSEEEQPGSK
ncbi:hypothetical protein NR798_03745 [Archangium gephyra]|uniref:hypothetical protein n=1 Tax=Archangium gephyra TaxID=48 RepID=UPI0035D4B90C